MTERHEIWQVADALQMDLRAASAKLTELRARLSALELPGREAYRCPTCGVTMTGAIQQAEHDYWTHDGPVPAHWERIEAMSEEAA